MSERLNVDATVPRPGRIGLTAIYLFFAAIVVRTLAWTEVDIRDLLPWYLGLMLAYFVLFTVVLLRPVPRREWLHLYFVLQAALILALLSLDSHLDFLTAFFVFLCYQASLVFTGRTRWMWCGIFVLLTGGSLMFYFGALDGLALALVPMAAGIVIPAYVIASQELELARARSQAMLDDLQATHQQLQVYVDQVEELAAMEERNRLARELHDSVSQTLFSIILHTRSTQILLERNPDRVRPQLEQLQRLTQDALTQMRSLITQLRPKDD